MSIIRFTKIATPAAAPTGKVQIFVDSADGDVKQIDDAGVVIPLSIGYTAENVANKSTTIALGASDTLYPTQKAVKTYVDAAIASLASVYQALLGYTPENVANKSDTTTLGASTTLYPTQHAVKTYVDTVVAALSSVYQAALGYTPENVANKDTTVTLGTSNTLYPTQNAVKTYVDANHPNTNPSWIQAAQALGSGIAASCFDMDPIMANGGSTLNTGAMRFFAIYIRKPMTITNFHFFLKTQGVYTADAYNGIGLYSYAAGTLTLLQSTTNNGNIWKAGVAVFQTVALSTPQVVTAGIYYIGMLYHSSAQTTAPVLQAQTTSGFGSNQSVLNYTNGAKIESLLAGQTALPSPQAMSGTTAQTTYAWIAVS